ncbi:MAG: hypothetical protein H7Z40_21720 [Phycisphaerae bacterium]|nr:hypothetical protein [Gemmatimonadaceae bacterium]
MRTTSEFVSLLHPHFRLQDLEESSAIVFGLWADFTLAYMNPAWEKFAGENLGQPQVETHWGLGANYLEAIAPALRPFYSKLLASTPDAGAALHPVSHLYECSSPTVFRQFSMQVYALKDRAGFVIINALVQEAPHDPVTHMLHNPDQHVYMDEHGIIVQCAHCRLVRQVADPTRWDWVPTWVEQSPESTSHGLCPLCFEYYYAEAA